MQRRSGRRVEIGQTHMTWPMLTIAVATAAFLAAGADVRLCLLFSALFPFAAGVSLSRCRPVASGSGIPAAASGELRVARLHYNASRG